MKHFSILLTAGTFLLFTANVYAQTEKDTVYVFLENMPDAGIYLPPPPDMLSAQYADDFAQWQWGKTVRPTDRGQQANDDSQWGINGMIRVHQGTLGFEISKERTPAIYKLLYNVLWTENLSTHNAKRKYMRTRPFAQYNEHTWGRFDNERELRFNGSYPSGHTALGWTTALVLSEMVPELQDTLLRTGFQYGESRVIVGAHYQSDVDAGFLCGTTAVAVMHASEFFQKDLEAARKEYCKIKGIKNVSQTEGFPDGTKVFDGPVTEESHRFYGDVIKYYETLPERETERGEQAKIDADNSIEALLKNFSVPAGRELSAEATPAIAALLSYARDNMVKTAGELGSSTFRERPYVRLNPRRNKTLISDDEEAKKETTSYPSTNAEIGWGVALLLVEIMPRETANDILTRGFEYGRSRIIAGYNYPSDVQTGRLWASATLAHLHTMPEFQKLLQAAKDELYPPVKGKKKRK
ncbi:MAG: phosphatase PAP2 family protein [Bacteroidaceae bacterium]|nr:phosphatase PAP2 family protein [Bacteroidaceae bacterium]MBO7111072.1 phosphatase PAP2 family protein [Bacteroidaceae bacterium]